MIITICSIIAQTNTTATLEATATAATTVVWKLQLQANSSGHSNCQYGRGHKKQQCDGNVV